MLASYVTGEYTSIWEKISASDTRNWGVQYHKSEVACTNLLEDWKKSGKKVNIGRCFFHCSLFPEKN
jgi:hypothetical protein